MEGFSRTYEVLIQRGSEKRRLTQHVTSTILDDNYKGTTLQFVLHFNEQLRQLQEISDPSEHFPPQIKLQVLQNAVRPVNDLRIVETLHEFQSMTTGYGKSSSLKYQTYYDLLIKACVRYDRTKKANIAKRGHIYQTTSTPNNNGFINQLPSETPDRDPYMGIDTPSDEFYTINTNQSGNRSLPSWTLLAVLWQMCHVSITYRMSSGAVLMMDKLS